MRKLLFFLPLSLLICSCGNNTVTQSTVVKRDSIPDSSTGPLISFEDSNGHGYKDMKGNIILPPIFGHCYTDTFNKGIAFVIDSTGALIGIDRTGKKILTPYFFDNGPDYISEGLFRYVENKKMGFADADGKIIISAKYEFVTEFKEGMACFGNGFTLKKNGETTLMKGGKWGFINTNGDTAIDQKYDEMAYFENGKCVIKQNGKSTTIIHVQNNESNATKYH